VAIVFAINVVKMAILPYNAILTGLNKEKLKDEKERDRSKRKRGFKSCAEKCYARRL
jgi:hypothetical protein